MRKPTATIDTSDDATVAMGWLAAGAVLALLLAGGGWRSLRPRGA